MSVNKVILVGRLGKDPDLRYTPSGQAVASFSLATTRRWKAQDGQNQEATTWHNIVAWGKQAEVMKEYLSKGREVYIEGRIDNRSYDDKEGNKRYVSEVVVESFSFIGGGGGGSRGEERSPAGGGSEAPASSGGDDDLPF
jgi:single-strand DNA-binding protein